jgi:capA domain-containing protein
MGKVKLTFSGDIMLANSTINFYKVNDGTYNFNRMFKDVKKNLEKSDFTVGNLETPITKNNEKIKYQQYRFTSPIEFAEAVKNAGFNFVTTANNHCLDNGKYGIKETIDALNEIRNCKYWHIL